MPNGKVVKYDSAFVAKLRKQLALDSFTIKKDKENKASWIIYSSAGDEYYLICPYQDWWDLKGFNSGASHYQKVCDMNLIETHIKHCENAD
ncbi:hypothetical protein [Brunnivagina elsteri]|uniref:Uncharacterized protein n=1 Tax=Brunnivagina elsteri CCALA 953 TaxID=987040 RepID=A0A2A2TE89_9CYAN|nr:hypothetical protein [Calothrix elsteri]PAX52052.1 hypothetical protein CK510_21335 [Calothrix elsteri CCALA 953]